MTLDPPDTSIVAQIKCVRRELGLRENVYSARVAAHRMNQREADCEIAAMRAVLETLEWCRDNRDRIIEILQQREQ